MEEEEKQLSNGANVLWNSAGNLVYYFVQWLFTAVVVWHLGYGEAGVFSLSMSIGTAFSAVALYGMRNYQTSDTTDVYSAGTYIASRVVTCGVSVVLCGLFVLANGYDQHVVACVLVYMLFKVSEGLSDVYQGILQKKMRMDYVGISFIIKSVLELALFIVAVQLLDDLLLAIVLLTASSFAVVFAYDRRLARKGLAGERASLPEVRSLLIACLPVALYSILFNAGAQVPRYVIEALMGAEQLGYYASVAMPVVIIQAASSFVFSPLVTPLAQHYNEGNWPEFTRLMKRILLFMIAIFVAAFIGFAVLGEWFLNLMFGDSILPYSYLMFPLVGCAAMTAIVWFLSAVITIMRKMRTLLVLSAVMFILIAVSCAPFIWAFGLNGASFALMAGLAVFSIGCVVQVLQIAKRRVG